MLEDTQIFGNNEGYTEWNEFLESQGIEIVDNNYDGYITDVMGIFATIDRIMRRLQKEYHKRVEDQPAEMVEKLKSAGLFYHIAHEITDLSDSMWLQDETPWLEFNIQMIQSAYCFLPYQVFKAIEPKIERVSRIPQEDSVIDGVDWWHCYYRIKPGEKLHVRAS